MSKQSLPTMNVTHVSVGEVLGMRLGVCDGKFGVGCSEGRRDGISVGISVGSVVVGKFDGNMLGCMEVLIITGLSLGLVDGICEVGNTLGIRDGFVEGCDTEGLNEGPKVGNDNVGNLVGTWLDRQVTGTFL